MDVNRDLWSRRPEVMPSLGVRLRGPRRRSSRRRGRRGGSRLEFELLVKFASEPVRVFSKDELARCIWRCQIRGCDDACGQERIAGLR
jgi:DNA-binding response OmpR family regulator